MYYFGRQFSNQPSPGFLCEDPADWTQLSALCWNQSSSRVWQTHWGCFCFRELLENLPLTNQTLFLPPSLPLSPLPSKRHGPLNPFFFLLSLSLSFPSIRPGGGWPEPCADLHPEGSGVPSSLRGRGAGPHPGPAATPGQRGERPQESAALLSSPDYKGWWIEEKNTFPIRPLEVIKCRTCFFRL